MVNRAQIMIRWLALLTLGGLASGCSFDATGLSALKLDNRTLEPMDAGPTDGARLEVGPIDGPTAREAKTHDGPACQTWDPAWSRRSKLTFDNVSLGAAASDALTDFPVLITLTPQRLQALSLRQDGADLRFVDADGTTALPYEVESWDHSGTSQVWVKVPQIDKSSSTDHIWLHHGNPGAAPPAASSTAVWSNGFSAVWHLSQDPAAAAPQFPDATGHANRASTMGATGKINQATGQIGGSITFPGNKGDYLEAPDSASLDLATSLTLESWIRPQVVNQDDDRYPVRKHGAYFIYAMRTYTTRPGHYVHLSGYDWYATAAQVPLTAKTWTYLVGTYDTTERVMRIYVDGQLSQTKDLAKDRNNPVGPTNIISNSTYPLRIGVSFPGEVDEVRVAAVKRSDGWIAAQHRSMTDAFVTYGAAEPTCP
jgi:biopolymer transport protein ExbB